MNKFTSRVAALVVMVMLLAAPSMGLAQAIPTGSKVRTQHDVNKEKMAWLYSMFTDAGMSDARNNPDEKKYINLACAYLSGLRNYKSLDMLEKTGIALVAQPDMGVSVLTLHGIILSENGKHADAINQLANVLQNKSEQLSSNFLRFYAAKYLLRSLNSKGQSRSKSALAWKDWAISSLASSISSGEIQSREAPVVFRIIELTGAAPFTGKRWGRLVQHMKQGHGANPWLFRMISAESEINAAWAARDSGKGDTGNEKGWENFAKHLANARLHLNLAYSTNPDYPAAAASMITLANAGRANQGETERFWFDRAVAAQMDYAPAYLNYVRALLPRWEGSHDQMIDFGKECLATGRFDTDVPLIYLYALRKVGGEYRGDAWRKVFREPGVSENLTKLFKGLMTEPKRKMDQERIYMQYALTQAWCGKYETARRSLDKIQTKLVLRNGFWGKALSWSSRSREEIDAEIEVFIGSHSSSLKDAETLSFGGKPGPAVSNFEQVMNASKDNPPVYAYLRDRIGRIRLNMTTDKGWRPLLTAAQNGKIKVVKYLLARDADVNQKERAGWTPLLMAIHKKDVEIVSLLLKSGADPNLASKDGTSALDLNRRARSAEISALLKQFGAKESK